MKLTSKKIALVLSLSVLASAFAVKLPYAEELIMGDESSVLEESITATDSDAELATPAIAFYAVANNANYNGTVTFVTSDGRRTVQFTDGSERLDFIDAAGNQADTGDKSQNVLGRNLTSYFVAWSTAANYSGRAGQVAFYPHETIADVFPDGIPQNAELHAKYWGMLEAMDAASNLTGKVTIDGGISNEEIMYNEFAVDNEETTNGGRKVTYWVSNGMGSLNSINLNADFVMNPFMQAVVRRSFHFQPGSAQYYGYWGDDQTSPSRNAHNENGNGYTFIDLHVKLDPRMNTNHTLEFGFDSYSFKPRMIIDRNYNKINNAVITTNDGDPRSVINVNLGGETEFIVRTVIRQKQEIPDAGYEEANNFNMQLVNLNNDNFNVSDEEIDRIARGQSAPLRIEGYIDGGAKLYGVSLGWLGTYGGPTAIPRVNARYIDINYRYNRVTFDKNSANYGDAEAQDIGTVYVVHGTGVSTDRLNTNALPNTDPDNFGDTMPQNPAPFTGADGNLLRFKGWNTQPDGSGEFFTGSYIVNEDMIVYGIWGTDEAPVITTRNITTCKTRTVDLLSLATASDLEDGDITDRVVVREVRTPSGDVVSPENFRITDIGDYIVTYRVTDSDGNIAENTAVITVQTGEIPVITTTNVTVKVNEPVNLRDLASATDIEDGNITDRIEITSVVTPNGNTITPNEFNTSVEGVYTITYSVTDNCGNTVTNTATVTVILTNGPRIITTNVTVPRYDYVNIIDLAKADDIEDGNITDRIEITSVVTPTGENITPDEFTTSLIGDYKITYKVTDSDGNTTTNTATVTVYNPANNGGSGGSTGGGGRIPTRPTTPTDNTKGPGQANTETEVVVTPPVNNVDIQEPAAPTVPVEPAKVTSIPKTADESNMMLWALGTIVAAIGLIIFSKKRKTDK